MTRAKHPPAKSVSSSPKATAKETRARHARPATVSKSRRALSRKAKGNLQDRLPNEREKSKEGKECQVLSTGAYGDLFSRRRTRVLDIQVEGRREGKDKCVYELIRSEECRVLFWFGFTWISRLFSPAGWLTCHPKISLSISFTRCFQVNKRGSLTTESLSMNIGDSPLKTWVGTSPCRLYSN